MKQVLFETRQKADELLQKALSVWQQSDQVDYLEGIEKDPVFSLLMMALAYQSNELDSEIERLKTEVLEDFARVLVPYEMGHAIPATAVVRTALQDDVAELPVGADAAFYLYGDHPFLPLLETRALNASVRSVVRLDGRRWKVTFAFKHPVTDLSQFAFIVQGMNYRDLNVSIKGQRLPLIKPWEYSELPLSQAFSPDSMTYNLGQICHLSSLPMDLFARQNVRLFIVDRHAARKFIPNEADQVEMVFEFLGVTDDFLFDKSSLVLNPVLLVNAQIHEATLTADKPIARLVGSQEEISDKDLTSREFLHLLRPMESQIFGHTELEVRGVAGDRFNQGSLMKLLNCIITKYHSDFYAFQQLKGVTTDNAIFQMETALSKLKEEGLQDKLRNVSGVYLMPRGSLKEQRNDFSLNIKYLTTGGAAVNALLSPNCPFTAPSGFNSAETKVVGVPVPGADEIREQTALSSMVRYYLVTSDRIVTMADIKVFCCKELMIQYGIGNELIKRFSVHKRLQQDNTGCGYEIVAEIVLVGTSFVKRSLQEKLSSAEILLQKMIEVRSTNIYPVTVSITIEEEDN